MNLHKYTEKLVLYVNDFLNKAFIGGEITSSLKCFFAHKSSKKINEDCFLELNKFHQSIDHRVWKYNLVLPHIKEKQILHNNAFFQLNDEVKLFCSKIGGTSSIDLQNNIISITLREDPT